MSLPRSPLLQYGVIALPLAFAGMPIYIHVPEFYVSEYGASLTMIGILLFAVRLMDAVQDPLIGYFSDRYYSHRVNMMIGGSIMLALGVFALFRPLSNHLMVWFTIALIVATTGFSIVTINLNTLGTLWKSSAFDKTRIASYRERFSLVGLLLAILLPPMLMIKLPAVQAYGIMTWVLVLLMIVGILFFLKWVRRVGGQAWFYTTPGISELQKEPGSQRMPSFSVMQKELSLLPAYTTRLLVIYALSMLASSIPAVLVLFFINDRLQLQSYTGIFLAVYFLAAIGGISLWQSVSRHRGKVGAWGLSMSMAILVFGWALFLDQGDWFAYLLICVLSGIALGAELTLPISILADNMEREKAQRDALPNQTFQCSLLALLTKLSLALSAGVVLPALQWFGYKPNAENSDQALLALSICYAGLPILIKAGSWLMLRWNRELIVGDH